MQGHIGFQIPGLEDPHHEQTKPAITITEVHSSARLLNKSSHNEIYYVFKRIENNAICNNMGGLGIIHILNK